MTLPVRFEEFHPAELDVLSEALNDLDHKLCRRRNEDYWVMGSGEPDPIIEAKIGRVIQLQQDVNQARHVISQEWREKSGGVNRP